MFGTPMLPRNAGRKAFEARELSSEPVVLSQAARSVVDSAVRGVCEHRGWVLHALIVLTNHVHVVASAPGPPEPVMNTFKSWCTRRLRESGLIGVEARVWSRHGSTIYLFRPENLAEKVEYVRMQQ